MPAGTPASFNFCTVSRRFIGKGVDGSVFLMREQLTTPVKCWVAMDSWYYVKSLYLGIEQLGFNWVTRAKSNSTLYRKVKIRGVERFITILPEVLFKEASPVFFGKRKEINRFTGKSESRVYKSKGINKKHIRGQEVTRSEVKIKSSEAGFLK
jgi:hypothetical protein